MKKLAYLGLILLVVLTACKKDEDKTSTISGVLKSESGEVLALSTVFLKQGDATVNQVITDDNGVFVFEDINPGVYTLKAFNEELKYSKDIEYVVDEGVDYNVEIIFSPYVSLSGNVFVDGYAYPATAVELYDSKKVDIIDETRLDMESSFEFYNIAPDVYIIHLTITHEHFETLLLYGYDGFYGYHNFDFQNFTSQEVYYLVRIEEDVERKVVLNINWNSSTEEFEINGN